MRKSPWMFHNGYVKRLHREHNFCFSECAGRVWHGVGSPRRRSAERLRWASMKRAIMLGILACIAVWSGGCVSQPHDSERDAILSLPWQQFDQTPGSGWRVYWDRHEYRAAADLIEVYLKQHQDLTVRQRAVSRFHAGQLRVYDGRTEAGVAHMKKALVPEIPPGLPDDWNIMVSAHIAFVTGDRARLVALKEQVAALPPSRVEWPRCPADLLDHFGERFGSWESR